MQIENNPKDRENIIIGSSRDNFDKTLLLLYNLIKLIKFIDDPIKIKKPIIFIKLILYKVLLSYSVRI